jgi:hypothetical protein
VVQPSCSAYETGAKWGTHIRKFRRETWLLFNKRFDQLDYARWIFPDNRFGVTGITEFFGSEVWQPLPVN